MPDQEAHIYAVVLGQTIAQLRERCGWSQGQLADRLHISQSRLSRLELGQVQADAFLLKKLAQVFGLDDAIFSRYVSRALEQTETLVRTTAPPARGLWWQTALKVAWMVGLAGLATYAVAMTLSQEPAEPDASHQRPKGPGRRR